MQFKLHNAHRFYVFEFYDFYEFEFPLTDGWSTGDPGTTAIHGSGKVGFRLCVHTINFTVADPEIELNGDSDSRIIFRVDGTDGTAFPDTRAVMVDLTPSLAVKTVDGKTTTLAGIPAYVPAEATGIFADIYPALADFGSLTITYTTA